MSFLFFDDSPGAIRRLPIYLLIDVSSTMSGARIQAVNQGMQLLYQELLESPQAIETVWISVITFGTRAEVVVPLVELTEFKPPSLDVRGATALGAAIELVIESLERDVHTRTSDETRGDYRPILFILTDGNPTDDWQRAVQRLRSHAYHPAQIIVLNCGDRDSLETLKQVGDTVLLMNEVTSDKLSDFFRWVSVTISTTSKKSIDLLGTELSPTILPKPPGGIDVV
jgi:uncharacterized protein YegL